MSAISSDQLLTREFILRDGKQILAGRVFCYKFLMDAQQLVLEGKQWESGRVLDDLGVARRRDMTFAPDDHLAGSIVDSKIVLESGR